ncbi:hypothetical protein PTKU64_27690 [Paraburkholderia terrae]|uniref:Uncharacterized protein n=2 Tax=Burkholderiaceae TaxID=119060 RepID=A0ABM7TLG9_9BURK|nr:hypothetical protein PTKU64_27690 [Paraburkholderia terrae]
MAACAAMTVDMIRCLIEKSDVRALRAFRHLRALGIGGQWLDAADDHKIAECAEKPEAARDDQRNA